MSHELGGYGAGRWGSTLVWGWKLTGVTGLASIVSDDIISAMERSDNANGQRPLVPSAVVYLDDVDVTAFVSGGSITLQGNNASNQADLQIDAQTLTINAHVTTVSIFIKYELAGNTYSVERFRGFVLEVQDSDEPGVVMTTLLCVGDGYRLTQKPPAVFSSKSHNFYYYVGEPPNQSLRRDFLSAYNCINAVLLASGFGPVIGSATDYFPYYFTPSQFKTALELISAVASGLQPSFVFFHPNQTVTISQWNLPKYSPFNFPLASQSKQKNFEPMDRVNKTIVTYANHRLTQNISGVLSYELEMKNYLYKNQTRISDEGLIEKRITTPYVSNDFNEDGVFFVAIMASAIVNSSILKKYQWTSALNPFVFPGESTVLSLVGGSTANVMVTRVVDRFEWVEGRGGGFWSDWEGTENP